MPVKEKYKDSETETENDIALQILADYREGLEKKQESEKKAKKEDQSE